MQVRPRMHMRAFSVGGRPCLMVYIADASVRHTRGCGDSERIQSPTEDRSARRPSPCRHAWSGILCHADKLRTVDQKRQNEGIVQFTSASDYYEYELTCDWLSTCATARLVEPDCDSGQCTLNVEWATLWLNGILA